MCQTGNLQDLIACLTHFFRNPSPYLIYPRGKSPPCCLSFASALNIGLLLTASTGPVNPCGTATATCRRRTNRPNDRKSEP